jgi:hypothetical protein
MEILNHSFTIQDPHQVFGLYLPPVSDFSVDGGGEGFTQSIVEQLFSEFVTLTDENGDDNQTMNAEDAGAWPVHPSHRVELPGQWRVYSDGEGGSSEVVTPADFSAYTEDGSAAPTEPSFHGAEDIAELRRPRNTAREAVWEVPSLLWLAHGTAHLCADGKDDWGTDTHVQGVFAFSETQARRLLGVLYPELTIDSIDLHRFDGVAEDGVHDAGFVMRPINVFTGHPALEQV